MNVPVNDIPILPPLSTSSSSDAETVMLDSRLMESGRKLKNYGTSEGPTFDDASGAWGPTRNASESAAGESAAAKSATESAAAAALGQNRAMAMPSTSFSAEMQIRSAPNSAFSVGSPPDETPLFGSQKKTRFLLFKRK